MVAVVLRINRSISPDCRAVKRCGAVSGVNFTALGSLKIAAAIARQWSMSKPVQLPALSGEAKPSSPTLVPHWTKPFFLTSSRVAAEAGARTTIAAASAARTDSTSLLFMTFCLPSGAEDEPQRGCGFRPMTLVARRKRRTRPTKTARAAGLFMARPHLSDVHHKRERAERQGMRGCVPDRDGMSAGA